MEMEVIGYSERGIINSIFYEMKFSQNKNNLSLLKDFLSLVSFPFLSQPINFQISDAKILIEQSFSEFGNPDFTIMENNNGKKQVIFFEAKVSAFKHWNISKEFKEFESRGNASNLFTQLHRMSKLIEALRTHLSQQNNQFNRMHFSEDNPRIGKHKIVLDAVERLAPYCSDAFFVALVPDTLNLSSFYQNTLKKYIPDKSQKWDISNWGYISWARVEEFCKTNSLRDTLKVFEFNKGQIYEG